MTQIDNYDYNGADVTIYRATAARRRPYSFEVVSRGGRHFAPRSRYATASAAIEAAHALAEKANHGHKI